METSRYARHIVISLLGAKSIRIIKIGISLIFFDFFISRTRSRLSSYHRLSTLPGNRIITTFPDRKSFDV
jgi:hypothetical protein